MFPSMKQVALLCALAGLVLAAPEYPVPGSAESNDVFDGYVSYSIEFASFPDFAGNKTHPNTFSDVLLDNLGQLQGHKPYIRVGGNTQDYALYNQSLPYALNGTTNPSRAVDYPTTVIIGPSYFESYDTWKDVKFSHGFNLGLGGNRSSGWQALLDTVPLACKALGNGKLYVWEYGNEPDLFSTSAQGPVRPANWSEATYVSQWHNGTRQIKALVQEHCPETLESGNHGYMAPSFAGVNNYLKEPAAWAAGLDGDQDIKLFSTHNYISGATSPGVTLQGTLMNHAVTKRAVDVHITEYNKILSQSSDPVPPLVFGETNSLYNQGRPGLSNTFGAALWGVDFNLYSASVGFKRVHMHMGTNFRYVAWQPIETDKATLGTKAPYYGSIAVAAALGSRPATVREILLSTQISGAELQPEAAYAIYTENGAVLSRLMILNLRSYNTTVDGAGLTPLPSPPPRGAVEYAFRLEGVAPGAAIPVRRLAANGSDAITGITWDGWSYNHELDGGRPVRLPNVTDTSETERVVVGEDGVVTVTVEDSSAALLEIGDAKTGKGKGEGKSKGKGKGEGRARRMRR